MLQYQLVSHAMALPWTLALGVSLACVQAAIGGSALGFMLHLAFIPVQPAALWPAPPDGRSPCANDRLGRPAVRNSICMLFRTQQQLLLFRPLFAFFPFTVAAPPLCIEVQQIVARCNRERAHAQLTQNGYRSCTKRGSWKEERVIVHESHCIIGIGSVCMVS